MEYDACIALKDIYFERASYRRKKNFPGFRKQIPINMSNYCHYMFSSDYCKRVAMGCHTFLTLKYSNK